MCVDLLSRRPVIQLLPRFSRRTYCLPAKRKEQPSSWRTSDWRLRLAKTPKRGSASPVRPATCHRRCWRRTRTGSLSTYGLAVSALHSVLSLWEVLPALCSWTPYTSPNVPVVCQNCPVGGPRSVDMNSVIVSVQDFLIKISDKYVQFWVFEKCFSVNWAADSPQMVRYSVGMKSY